MAKHALAERLTPAGICDQLRSVEGVAFELLQGGERLVIDLQNRPALSPLAFFKEARVWQRLREIIVLPDPNLPKYGLVEAMSDRDLSRLMLVELAAEGGQARILRVLGDQRATADGLTWQSTLQVSPDNRFIGVEHGGAGATEIIGATTYGFQGSEHLLPVEVWAPPATEVAGRCFPQQSRMA